MDILRENFIRGTTVATRHKVRKFRKFSQQTGIDIYLEPKTEEFRGKCNFCHVYGHDKANCKKYMAWLEKKGITKH